MFKVIKIYKIEGHVFKDCFKMLKANNKYTSIKNLINTEI